MTTVNEKLYRIDATQELDQNYGGGDKNNSYKMSNGNYRNVFYVVDCEEFESYLDSDDRVISYEIA